MSMRNADTPPIHHAAQRRSTELWALALLALGAWYVFDLHTADLQFMDVIFSEDANSAWPIAELDWMRAINDYFIPAISWIAALTALALIVAGGRHPQRRLWRTVGVFLLTSLLLGPGLLVNGVFKSQWGRPRPADIVRYGGDYEYRHPMNPGQGGKREDGGQGRSFPSGHAAMAFWTTALFFLARHLRPRWATRTLAAAISFGVLIGITRILCGRHFPSDIVWAGMLVFTSNWLTFYVLLRCPQQFMQQRRPSATPQWGDAVASGAVQ